MSVESAVAADHAAPGGCSDWAGAPDVAAGRARGVGRWSVGERWACQH
jgi:hypothetical protein